MELWTILTYISIIIAIYALSTQYLKIQWKLANILYKSLFFISMVLLFLLSFPSVQNFCFVTALKKVIENIVKTDIPQDIYFFILRFIQIISLLVIINTKTLRNWNIKKFQKLLDSLIIEHKWDILFILLEKNIKKIFLLRNKRNRAWRLHQKYCTEPLQIIINWNTYSSTKKDFWKITWRVFKKSQAFLKIVLPLFYQDNHILNDTMSDQLARKLWNSNEKLWLQFIEQYIKYNDSWLQEFSKQFLIELLLNQNNVTYYQLKEVDYEKDTIENKNMGILLQNSEKLSLESILSIVIHKLIFNRENKTLLNKYYSPSEWEYNIDNKDIVLHIWRLIRLYNFIDWKKLHLWNIPIFFIKDLIEITDWTLYDRTDILEYQTATYYLIIEIFEMIEKICNKTEWKYLDIYFMMIGYCLWNYDWYSLWSSIIPENFKKNIIKHCMYFFCDMQNREIKKESLTNILLANRSRKCYFDKRNEKIDRIWHDIWARNADIFKIIDNSPE